MLSNIKAKLFPMLLFVTLLTAVIISCTETDTASTETYTISTESGAATFELVWHDLNPRLQDKSYIKSASIDCSSYQISTIECLVYDDNSLQLSHGGPWECVSGQGTVENIAPGSLRKFVVLGKDSNGEIVFLGKKDKVSILAGVNHIGNIDIYNFKPAVNNINNETCTIGECNLGCTKNANALQYTFHISTDDSFQDTLSWEGSYTPNYIPSGLTIGQTYYWYVVLSDDSGINSIRSDIYSFKTMKDETSPQISSTTPSNEVSEVPLNMDITVTFNEAMDLLSLNSSNFILREGGSEIVGNISYTGTTAKFSPLNAFDPDTDYIATIKNSVVDLAGNRLQFDYNWTFTTGNTSDLIPPQVNSTNPVNDFDNTAINATIAVTFSEPVDASSLKPSSFLVNNGDIEGSITYNGTTATFSPATALDFSTTYSAKVTTTIKDLSGNALAQEYSWMFATGSAPDTEAPQIVSSYPVNGETNISPNSTITITFNEAIDTSSINTGSFLINDGTIAGNVTYFDKTATFNPFGALDLSATYSAKVTTAIKDLSGNPFDQDFIWSFSTGSASDTTAPQVVSTEPDNNATSIPSNSTIMVHFDEAMSASSINTASFLVNNGGVQGNVTYEGTSAIFTPLNLLDFNQNYNVTIATQVQDLSGNMLADDYSWSFVTGDSEWTRLFGTPNDEEGDSMAVDTSGNAYVTGWSYGDPGGNVNAGEKDIYVTKYDMAGNKQWLNLIGTTGDDLGMRVAVDSMGYSYVTGYTDGNLNGETNNGVYDCFVAKLDENGALKWLKLVGTSSEDSGWGIGVDEDGAVYIGGISTGNIGGNINQGSWDLFLAKYNSVGQRLWVRNLGSSAEEKTRGMVVDADGNIYLTGYTAGNLDGHLNQGIWDIFLAKYDSNGVKVWVKLLGTSSTDFGKDVTLDTSGNIYVTGWTYGNLSGQTNSGGMDAFIAKYNASGTLQWTKLLGTSGIDRVNSIKVDEGNGIYVAGYSTGNLSGEINSGGEDIFVSKFTLNGSFQWTWLFGTSSNDRASWIWPVDGNNAYIVGHTSGNLNDQSNSGQRDPYVMRVNLTN